MDRLLKVSLRRRSVEFPCDCDVVKSGVEDHIDRVSSFRLGALLSCMDSRFVLDCGAVSDIIRDWAEPDWWVSDIVDVGIDYTSVE